MALLGVAEGPAVTIWLGIIFPALIATAVSLMPIQAVVRWWVVGALLLFAAEVLTWFLSPFWFPYTGVAVALIGLVVVMLVYAAPPRLGASPEQDPARTVFRTKGGKNTLRDSRIRNVASVFDTEDSENEAKGLDLE